jgi:hypothetical protein
MEEFFRNRAEKIRVNPQIETWGKIEERLDADKKRRRGFLWFFLGGLVTGAMVVLPFVFLNKGVDVQLTDNSNEIENVVQVEEEPPPIKIAEQNEIVEPEEGELATKTIEPSVVRNENPGKSISAIEKGEDPLIEIPYVDNNVVFENHSNEDATEAIPYLEPELDDASVVNADNGILQDETMPTEEKSPKKSNIKPGQKLKFCLLAHGGIGRTFYTNFSKENDVNSLSSLDNIHNDKANYGSTFGLRMEGTRNRKFYIGAGITVHNYSWTSKVGGSKAKTTLMDGRVVLNDTVTMRPGYLEINSLNVKKDELAYNVGTDVEVKNRITYWAIPVYMRYKFLESSRFNLSANVGVSVDYLSSASVLQYNNLVSSHVARSEDSERLNKWGVSALGSIRAEYNLGGRVSLLMEPEFKSSLSSFYNYDKSNPQRSRLTYWGVNLGLRYCL